MSSRATLSKASSCSSASSGRSGREAIRPKVPSEVTYFGWSLRQTAVHDREDRWWLATGQGLLRYPASARFPDLASTPPRIFTRSRRARRQQHRPALRGPPRRPLGRHLWSAPLERWARATGTFRSYGRGTVFLPGCPPRLRKTGRPALDRLFGSGPRPLARRALRELRPAGTACRPGPIQYLLVDRSGRLWIATEGRRHRPGGRAGRPPAPIRRSSTTKGPPRTTSAA